MEPQPDTVVKMALDTLCKDDIRVDGTPLVDILRDRAVEMHKLASEVSHLINLHFLERCEKVIQDQPPPKISGKPYDCDPRIEEPWAETRVLKYFYAISLKCGRAKVPVELLAARQ